jgi:hypothetical protein
MTFLGLEPRIVFLPTSQLEYLQKSAVLDKKNFEFSTFERKFCVENSFSGFHYKIVQQLLNLEKKPILQFWRQLKLGTQIYQCTENQDRH